MEGDILQGGASGASMGASLGPYGALAGGVIGAGASWFLGNQAARARRAAAMESVRRQDQQNAYTLGDATARAAASGVELTGGGDSFSKYLSDMSAEFRRQHDWAVKQANRGASISETSNAIQGLTGLGSSLFRFASSQNWFQANQPALGAP